MKMKRYLLGMCLFFCLHVSSQVRVTGRVLSQDGRPVEFVSIKVDSLFFLSDLNGNFDFTVPHGHNSDMFFSHISYHSIKVPYSSYEMEPLTIHLTEKVQELGAVTISGLKGSEKKIAAKGMKMPGDVSFRNIKNTIFETGPVISKSHDYQVRNLEFKMDKCTYTTCTVRIIIYDVTDGRFTPILHEPLYVNFSNKSQNVDYVAKLKEDVKLQKRHKYYVGLAVVSTNGIGEIHFPAYIHKGYVRNLGTNKTRKFPATMGISLRGVEI
jgi:hypothetical protein